MRKKTQVLHEKRCLINVNMVDSPENLTMIEHDQSIVGQSDVSLNLDLPSSESSSSRSDSKARKDYEFEKHTQKEKRNFSVVLMKTILETLHSLVRSKLLLLQSKRFFTWKNSNHSTSKGASIYIRKKLATLSRIAANKQLATLGSAFGLWSVLATHKQIQSLNLERLKNAKAAYMKRIIELKGQCDYLLNKNTNLEAETQLSLQKAKAHKTSRVKEGNFTDRGIEELVKENKKLKLSLDAKEKKILQFFEEMSELIVRARNKKLKH